MVAQRGALDSQTRKLLDGALNSTPKQQEEQELAVVVDAANSNTKRAELKSAEANQLLLKEGEGQGESARSKRKKKGKREEEEEEEEGGVREVEDAAGGGDLESVIDASNSNNTIELKAWRRQRKFNIVSSAYSNSNLS